MVIMQGLVRYRYKKPTELDWSDWHISLIKPEDLESGLDLKTLIKVATGRCARVSYLNHFGERVVADDIRLHNNLLAASPQHLTPFEHSAQARVGRYANFSGWQSYRNQLERERR